MTLRNVGSMTRPTDNAADMVTPGAVVKLAVASAATRFPALGGGGGMFCGTFSGSLCDCGIGLPSVSHGGASLGYGTWGDLNAVETRLGLTWAGFWVQFWG